jgi:outer membrane lipoprotein SlyB
MKAMNRSAVMAPLLAVLLALSCATTTMYAPYPPPPARPGHIQSVTEMVRRVEGNPAGGALAGALIGGILFGGRGPGALFGAATGAAVGAAASQGVSESRTWHVVVHFDDGEYGVFVYGAPPPFQVGQPVLLTPQGLAPM